MVLTANQLLGRDQNGKLLPIEVQVKGFPDVVMVTPLSRGELLEMRSKLVAGKVAPEEVDFEYVIKHLDTPKLTEEQVRSLPVKHLEAVVQAILKASGLGGDDAPVDAISKAEEELKKKPLEE
jgi:hypothetical protein